MKTRKISMTKMMTFNKMIKLIKKMGNMQVNQVNFHGMKMKMQSTSWR